MIEQITHDVSTYFSLGQYFNATSSELSSDACLLIDKFIISCPLDQIEKMITTMSANLTGILADKRNGRVVRSDSDESMARQAKTFTTYNAYINQLCDQEVPSNLVPSIYHYTHEHGSFEIHVNPSDEIKYEYNGKFVTYEQMLVDMLEKSKMSSSRVSVPKVKPITKLASLISGVDPIQVSMRETKIDDASLEDAVIVSEAIASGVANITGSPVDRVNDLARPDGGLVFRKDKKFINVPQTTVLKHRGMDIHGVIDNGKIAKAYWDLIKLDPSLKSALQKEHFDDALQNRKPYTYWNKTWLNKMPDEQKQQLSLYWFLVIPGSDDIVLRLCKAPMKMWNKIKMLDPFLAVVNRIHTFYALLRCGKNVINFFNFLVDFIEKNNLFKMRVGLVKAFDLFDKNVKIPIDISHSNVKVANKIYDIAAQLLSSDQFDMDVDDDERKLVKNAVTKEMLSMFDDVFSGSRETKEQKDQKGKKRDKKVRKIKKSSETSSNDNDDDERGLFGNGNKKNTNVQETKISIERRPQSKFDAFDEPKNSAGGKNEKFGSGYDGWGGRNSNINTFIDKGESRSKDDRGFKDDSSLFGGTFDDD